MVVKKIIVTHEEQTSTYEVTINNQSTFTINDKIIKAEAVNWDASNNILTYKIGDQLYKSNIKPNNIILLKNTSPIYTVSEKKAASSTIKEEPKNVLVAPLAGRIVKNYVTLNQFVKRGEKLVVIESMKMENEIQAETDAFIKSISIKEGDLVQSEQVLMTFEFKKG